MFKYPRARAYLLHDGSTLLAGVGLDGVALGRVTIAQHHDVVAGAEGVRVDGLRVDDHLGVLPGGLAGRGTVVVPLRPEQTK